MKEESGCLGSLSGCGMLLSLIILIAGGLLGCDDIRYSYGETKTAEAEFTEFKKVWTRKRGFRRGNSIYKYVMYRFTDSDGKSWKGYDKVLKSWEPPADGKLKIEYRPGKIEGGTKMAESRLIESRGFVCKYAFYAGIAGLLACGVVAMFFSKGKERQQ